MQNVSFKFNGKKFNANVDDNFLDLPVSTQRRRLASSLDSKYGLKKKDPKEDKNILDYLSLLERPIQAVKVGVKESGLGGVAYEAFGGVDLTPREGFLTGAWRGFTGQDEIRTQDALPDDMNPYLKMGIGFVGDVVTDPLTFFGPQAVRAIGSGIKKASDATGATPVVSSAADKIVNANIPFADRKVADVLRNFNVQTGKGKEVKGVGTQASYNDLQTMVEEATTTGMEDLSAYFGRRAGQLGIAEDQVKLAFRQGMERKTKTREIRFTDEDGVDKGMPMLDEEGKPLINKFGKPVMQQEKIGYEKIDKKAAKILGDEGIQQVDKWSDLFDETLKYGEAFGQPIREITSKGYFPRIITREWTDLKKDIDIKELSESVDAPVFGTNYKGQRVEIGRDKPFDEAEKQFREFFSKEYMDNVGGTTNPIDIPFLESDPIIAMGTRLSAQAKAAQRKWFLDEITDSGYGIGPMFNLDELKYNFQVENPGLKPFKTNSDGTFGPNPKFLQFVKDSAPNKAERNIGLWLKKSEDGVWQQRTLNSDWMGRLDKKNPQWVWEDANVNQLFRVDDYRKVEGVPSGYIRPNIVDEEYNLVFEQLIDESNLGYNVPVTLRNGQTKTVREALEEARAKSPDEVETVIRKLYGDQTPRYSRKGGSQAFDANVQRYRDISQKAQDSARIAANQPVEEFYAPAVIQRQIKDTLDVMSGPSGRSNKFVRFYDKAQNTWKSWSLGVRPAYHTRNAIGNIWNMYMIAGVAPNLDQMINQAGKLQYYARFGGSEQKRQKILANITGAKGGLAKAASKVYKKIDDKEWTKPDYAGTGKSMKELYEAAQARGVTAGHYTADTIREMQIAMQVRAGQGSTFERLIGPENPAVRTGFAIGGTIEGNARFTTFLHTMREINKNRSKFNWIAPDGVKYNLASKIPEKYFKTVKQDVNGRGINTQQLMTDDDIVFDVAARQVKEALFDYGDLSAFEQNVLKRAMPFYTWSRKNIPAQFKALVQNPQRAEKLAIAKQQFEHETGDMDASDYGKFWGDRVPVFLGNESEGVIKAFTLLNLLPMADLQYVLDPKRVFGELATPFVKQPIEQLMNYDTFMKRAISATPDQTDDFLGVKLSPRLHHLAKLLVPLGELNRLNPANVFGVNEIDPVTGKSVRKQDAFYGLGAGRESYKDVPQTARWIRFFSGVPQYDVNLKRIKYFENKNLLRDVAELKGRIKWAVRKGENRKLVELYDLLEAVQLGKTTDPFERA